jgi:hypothetical protein
MGSTLIGGNPLANAFLDAFSSLLFGRMNAACAFASKTGWRRKFS